MEDTYQAREAYYRTMQTNVMAEAVCSFHRGGQLLHCKQGKGAGGLVVFRDQETLEADLQLKDNVVELNHVLFWVTQCEVQEVMP